MLSGRRATTAINVLGGTAVLGSYAACLLLSPDRAGDFWGDVPDGLRPVYTVNMLLAAAGYFAFTFYVMFRLPTRADGASRPGLRTFNALYALILVPSALWMPLTFAMLDSPSDALWWSIRLVLALVGLGALGLLAGLVAARPREPSLAHTLAVLGALAFASQTAVLDALVWPAYFPA